MKTFAVSQRIDEFPERQEIRDGLDQKLVAFIAATGGISAPVPNGLTANGELSMWLEKINPDAMVLSGGNDIGQYPMRDETEHQLLTYASNKQIPALGICRGMQMMAHWSGTKLKPVQGHICTHHQLLGDIVGRVNSFHGLSLSSPPKNFSVLAWSEDGEIEAIRHQALPWEGWMWHPEREPKFCERDIERLKALIL